ncbi:MAG: FAD-binding domain-containing protein [Burkholderiaceae bacterium]
MPPHPIQFPPDDTAWQRRVARIDPVSYARTRNHLGGAVTALSPYITHGFVNLPEVHALIAQRTGRALGPEDKLFAEFGWREFFQHVWLHQGDAILRDLRPALPGVRYRSEIPPEVRSACTGIPVIDQAVRTLYRTGWLHNHARMWLASYLVHLCKVNWRSGADWMHAHLLDGDLASNHLSWQWIAGTFSAKPYLFNADNVARFAPRDWHSPGTVIDCTYEQLEAVARSNQVPAAKPGQAPGLGALQTHGPEPEPPVFSRPPTGLWREHDPTQLAQTRARSDADLEWVHPWALSSRSGAHPRIGLLHAEFHARFPWSEQRWRFVLTRMREVCDTVLWFDPSAPDQAALSPGVIRHTLAPGYRDLMNAPGLRPQPASRLLPQPSRPCASFSSFYRDATARWVSTPIR